MWLLAGAYGQGARTRKITLTRQLLVSHKRFFSFLATQVLLVMMQSTSPHLLEHMTATLIHKAFTWCPKTCNYRGRGLAHRTSKHTTSMCRYGTFELRNAGVCGRGGGGGGGPSVIPRLLFHVPFLIQIPTHWFHLPPLCSTTATPLTTSP